MKLLNHRQIRAIAVPFMNRALLSKARLEVVFEDLREYLAADDASKLSRYEQLQTRHRAFLSDCETLKTDYVNRLLVRPLTKALADVEADFRASPASQPSSLTIVPSDKRYPLKDFGAEIGIRLAIKTTPRSRSTCESP
jgi:hypothetical protein